jgi:hypothetical protein
MLAALVTIDLEARCCIGPANVLHRDTRAHLREGDRAREVIDMAAGSLSSVG